MRAKILLVNTVEDAMEHGFAIVLTKKIAVDITKAIIILHQRMRALGVVLKVVEDAIAQLILIVIVV